jgi:cell division protein FtsQ
MQKRNWRKILTTSLWILTGAGAIVLLGAAMQKKDQKKCTGVKIEITGAEKHMFIDEKDVMDMLNTGGSVEGSRLSMLRLRTLETMVEKNPWVRNAEMFVDNQQVLQVRIEERQPVARVFTMEGTSFYVDSGALRLPLSERISARVPVFTGFPSDKPILAKPDSALLLDLVLIGEHILADSFWMAQVAQVDITPQAHFELIPVIGDHTVDLGNAEDIGQKFARLYTFYRSAWLQNGINTYEKLDLKYNNQVVAIRKGTNKAKIDSAKAKEIMDAMIMQQPEPEKEPGTGVSVPADTKALKDTVSLQSKITPPVKSSPVLTTKSNSDRSENNKITTNALSNGKKQTAPVKDNKKQQKDGPRAVMKKP